LYCNLIKITTVLDKKIYPKQDEKLK
jgi:hypothetical protein